MNVDTVHLGDAATELQQLPDESVHVICTSPPYWQQREYDGESVIGAEETVEEYFENLVDVFAQCYRVLRDDGSLLLNMGDVYVEKEKQRLPHRFAGWLSREGLTLRNDLVWAKEHGKPDPATDRRACTHEYVFHFTKGDDYWYDETVCGGDHTSVIEAPTATSTVDHLAVYSEELIEAALTGVAPPEVCYGCGCPYRRDYERVPRPFADPERVQSQRAYELYEQSDLTEEHIEAVQAAGISDVGAATETEDGHGRNAERVQRLASEAKDVLGGYYREFTMVEKVPRGFDQQCDCDAPAVGGIVLDPFIGSGTTAVVARRLGYRYLGIDCNREYVETTRQRVMEVNA